MRLKSTILFGKTINTLTRLFNLGGGSAAPGYYALKLQPDLISSLITQIPQNIIITGTNGKTTTAKLISHILRSKGLKVISNSAGSNLERGIASTLIIHSPLSKIDIGIWEVDEAALNRLLPLIKPQMVVFLNVFRDQLDRYGEVDSVVSKWSQSLSSIDFKTTVILNGDDLNVKKLADISPAKVVRFGLLDQKISGERSQGNVKKHRNLDLEAFNIKNRGLEGSNFQINTREEKVNVSLNLPGIYHIYDFLAAYAVLTTLNLKSKEILKSLISFTPAFGRVEKILIPTSPKNKREGFILLIKNPVGATQVFKTISPELGENDRLLIALNDNFADGTDVSWIWDANFEVLQNSSRAQSRDIKIFVSGKRAYDLALRLKYAGFETNNLKIEPDLKKAFVLAKTKLRGRLFILPTYTALLELQRVLSDLKIKKLYWKET